MEYLNLRIKDNVKEMLREIAERENRSLTQEIEYLIKKEYERGVQSEILGKIVDV